MAFQPPRTNEEGRALMDRFIKTYGANMSYHNFDSAFNRAIGCTSATLETDTSTAKATFSLAIPPLYGNNPKHPSIHGGAVATFFDNITSLAMLLVKRHWDGFTGVSRTLSVTYFRPLREGEKVVIEAEVIQYGKRNATIRGVLKRESDGVVLATCQHDKARPEGAEFFRL